MMAHHPYLSHPDGKFPQRLFSCISSVEQLLLQTNAYMNKQKHIQTNKYRQKSREIDTIASQQSQLTNICLKGEGKNALYFGLEVLPFASIDASEKKKHDRNFASHTRVATTS